ncbi:hypothetical protein ACJJTC_002232 [Scirpophaga incertulas]
MGSVWTDERGRCYCAHHLACTWPRCITADRQLDDTLMLRVGTIFHGGTQSYAPQRITPLLNCSNQLHAICNRDAFVPKSAVALLSLLAKNTSDAIAILLAVHFRRVQVTVKQKLTL